MSHKHGLILEHFHNSLRMSNRSPSGPLPGYHQSTSSLYWFVCLDSSYGASLMAQQVTNLPAMQETQETWVRSLAWEDPLEKEMAIHSSILAWKITWTEEPGVLQSVGLQRVRHDWVTHTHRHTHTHTQFKQVASYVICSSLMLYHKSWYIFFFYCRWVKYHTLFILSFII